MTLRGREQRWSARFNEQTGRPAHAWSVRDMADQELSLKITGDASGAVDAAHSLAGAMQGLLDDLTGFGKGAQDFGVSVADGIKDPLGASSSALKGVLEDLGPFGVGLGALGGGAIAAGVALVDLAGDAAAVGEQIRTMSIILDESTEKVSQLKYIADVGGSSLDQMKNLSFTLERQMLATGAAAKKFSDGLADLGIDEQAFRAADLNDKVLMLSEGFNRGAASGDNMRAITEVLTMRGKQYAEFLSHDLTGAQKDAETGSLNMSAAEVKAADDFGMAQRKLSTEWANAKIKAEELLIPVASLILKMAEGTGAAIKQDSAVQGAGIAWKALTGWLGENALAEE